MTLAAGWNLLHRRGALDSFHTLVEGHFDIVAPILRNRTVIFGRQVNALNKLYCFVAQ
jgi:hypothetical protein